MEYICLHRCIRNTSSDTEGLTEYQLQVGRSPWPLERNIQIHEKLSRTKEGDEKEESELVRTRPAPRAWGNWSRGQIPTLGQLSGNLEKHLKLLESASVDLWQSEWNENHTDNPCHNSMNPGQGCKYPGMYGGWELKHRDWRAIPGWGLLLTLGRRP